MELYKNREMEKKIEHFCLNFWYPYIKKINQKHAQRVKSTSALGDFFDYRIFTECKFLV